MNDGWVIMMGLAREPRTHKVGVGCLHVIDDDQSSGLHGQLPGEVLSPIQQLYRARSLPGQFPVGRLHMTVKDQDMSWCPGHDPRGQCHLSSGQYGLATPGTASEEHVKGPLQSQVVRLIFASIGGAGGGHIAGKFTGAVTLCGRHRPRHAF